MWLDMPLMIAYIFLNRAFSLTAWASSSKDGAEVGLEEYSTCSPDTNCCLSSISKCPDMSNSNALANQGALEVGFQVGPPTKVCGGITAASFSP